MDVWCVCAFFCVCVVLCLGKGLAPSWSTIQGVLPSVNDQETERSALCSKWEQRGRGGGGEEWCSIDTRVSYKKYSGYVFSRVNEAFKKFVLRQWPQASPGGWSLAPLPLMMVVCCISTMQFQSHWSVTCSATADIRRDAKKAREKWRSKVNPLCDDCTVIFVYARWRLQCGIREVFCF
jgi:hypothetical protein